MVATGTARVLGLRVRVIGLDRRVGAGAETGRGGEVDDHRCAGLDDLTV